MKDQDWKTLTRNGFMVGLEFLAPHHFSHTSKYPSIKQVFSARFCCGYGSCTLQSIFFCQKGCFNNQKGNCFETCSDYCDAIQKISQPKTSKKGSISDISPKMFVS